MLCYVYVMLCLVVLTFAMLCFVKLSCCVVLCRVVLCYTCCVLCVLCFVRIRFYCEKSSIPFVQPFSVLRREGLNDKTQETIQFKTKEDFLFSNIYKITKKPTKVTIFL